MARPRRWKPHLVLLQKKSGHYWYVAWRDIQLGSVHPGDHVPFMCRNSEAAKKAHAFAAKLNQARGAAF